MALKVRFDNKFQDVNFIFPKNPQHLDLCVSICFLASSTNAYDEEEAGLCIPDVIVEGVMLFMEQEGDCWVFLAKDGTIYEPSGGPWAMYQDGVRGTMYAQRQPGVSICMLGEVVEVCDFVPITGGCGNNSHCYFEDYLYCEKPVGQFDGPGFCVRKPEFCLDVYDPVCGCDAFTYGNECEAAMHGISVAYYGPCVLDTCPGDFDYDRDVDGSDLAAFPSGGATITLEESAEDYGRIDCPAFPRIEEYSNSGCLPGTSIDPSVYQYPRCGEDEIEDVVDDHSIRIIHNSATYNCCPEDIRVSLSTGHSLLSVTEEEIGGGVSVCDAIASNQSLLIWSQTSMSSNIAGTIMKPGRDVTQQKL